MANGNGNENNKSAKQRKIGIIRRKSETYRRGVEKAASGGNSEMAMAAKNVASGEKTGGHSARKPQQATPARRSAAPRKKNPTALSRQRLGVGGERLNIVAAAAERQQ
jgi:hypothetical protein